MHGVGVVSMSETAAVAAAAATAEAAYRIDNYVYLKCLARNNGDERRAQNIHIVHVRLFVYPLERFAPTPSQGAFDNPCMCVCVWGVLL